MKTLRRGRCPHRPFAGFLYSPNRVLLWGFCPGPMRASDTTGFGVLIWMIGNLQKLFFDDLTERFWHNKSFGKFGILCVLWTFQNALLGQKIRSNHKRGVFRGARFIWKLLRRLHSCEPERGTSAHPDGRWPSDADKYAPSRNPCWDRPRTCPSWRRRTGR